MAEFDPTEAAAEALYCKHYSPGASRIIGECLARIADLEQQLAAAKDERETYRRAWNRSDEQLAAAYEQCAMIAGRWNFYAAVEIRAAAPCSAGTATGEEA